MSGTDAGGRRYGTWILLLAVLWIGCAMTFASCGSDGSSDGSLCSQCGTTDGSCISPHFVTDQSPDSEKLLCNVAAGDETFGPPCSVALLCLRKLDSAQRRCFPATETDATVAAAAFQCDGSRPNTEVRVCGNGTTESGEECDDGNTTAGDGCDEECQSEPACGDGTVDEGEECDDGNTTAGDGCDATCQNESTCGNGTVDDGEECDDSGESATCNDDCTTAICGDGKFNDTAGETCDGADLDDTVCDDVCDEANPDLPVGGVLGCNVNCLAFDATNCTNCVFLP